MTDKILAGSILVAGGTYLPQSFLLQSGSDSNGWAAIQDIRTTFEKAVRDAGWTFFFMAGIMKATVFGFNRQKALGLALNRLMADVKSQHCNSIEITEITDRSFLRMPYVSVFAHARHLQQGPFFSGSK